MQSPKVFREVRTLMVAATFENANQQFKQLHQIAEHIAILR